MATKKKSNKVCTCACHTADLEKTAAKATNRIRKGLALSGKVIAKAHAAAVAAYGKQKKRVKRSH